MHLLNKVSPLFHDKIKELTTKCANVCDSDFDDSEIDDFELNWRLILKVRN